MGMGLGYGRTQNFWNPAYLLKLANSYFIHNLASGNSILKISKEKIGHESVLCALVTPQNIWVSLFLRALKLGRNYMLA